MIVSDMVDTTIIIDTASLEDAVILRTNYSKLAGDAADDAERSQYIVLMERTVKRIQELV